MATRPAVEQSERRGLATPVAPNVSRRTSYLSSSIGTKVLIGLTGLLLLLYLVLHLVGNLLIFLGPTIFNGYSAALLSNPLIYPVEVGLALVVLVHIYKAVANWAKNRAARPVGYYRTTRRLWGYGWGGPPSRKTVASSTMIFSGLLTLLFLVIHLRQFKFGAEYLVQAAGGGEIRDLYRTELEVFASPLNVLFYLVAMVVIGAHLWHGGSSAFNSLGVDHPTYTPAILRAGRVLASLIAVGFILIALWAHVAGGSR